MKVRELLTTWELEVDQGTLDKFSAGIDLAKKAMLGAIAGVAALSAAIVKLADSAFEYIDSSEEMAMSAGVTTQFFQELAFAVSRAGISTEQLSTSLAFFQRSIFNARKGGKEASEAFRELGITQKQLKSLGSEALFVLVADKLSKIEDPAKRGAVAMQLLGRGGAKMLPAFKGGAAALAEVGDRARELGLVTGPEAAEAAEKFEAGIADLKGALKGLIITIGTALMPIITDLAGRVLAWYQANRKIIESKLKEWLIGFSKWVAKAADWVVKIVREVVAWVEQQGGLTGLLQKFGDAVEPVVMILKGLWFVLKLIIDVLVLVGEALGVTAAIIFLFFTEQIPAALDAVAKFFTDTWNGIANFFTSTITAIVDFFKNAWSTISEWFSTYVTGPIVAVWQAAVDGISAAIDFVMRKIEGAATQVAEVLNYLPGVNIGTKKLGETPGFQALIGGPLAAAPGGAPGARTTSVAMGNVNVSVGGSSASAGEIGGAVQKAMRDELDRMFRHAGADIGR